MLLVIDSTTTACSIALIEGDQLIGEHHEIVGRGHAERLLPMISGLIEGRRPAAILVDCGPGSFTGVRVGLAAAQGLAIGWQVPLYGYSSMALIASTIREGTQIGVASQGGHGQLFVQSYGHDPLEALDRLQSLPPEAAAAAIDAHLVIGSGAQALVDARGHGEWREALPRAADARFLPESLCRLPPLPIYGRAPDAKPMQ